MTLPPFQAILDAHRDDVYRFLLSTVGPADADDCFQETFLSALRAYPRLRHGENLRGWLLTIAHRKGMDAHRARARRPVPVDELPEPAAPAAEADGMPELWSRVRDLPHKQRAAVAHRYVTDLSYREIAAVLDCSEEAARRSVHEGLKKLREAVER
ncbi:MAG: RNA polymerase sigma factor [Thermoleophilaceae bacterium]